MKRHIPEDQISAWVDHQLDRETAELVEAHLCMCSDCRTLAEDMSAITEAYRSAESRELPPYLWSRIAAGMGEASAHRARSLRGWLSSVLARPSWYPVPALVLVFMISIVGVILFVEYRASRRFEESALAQIEVTRMTMASLDAQEHNPFSSPVPDDAKVNPFARSSVDPLVNPFSTAQQNRQQERR